MKIYTKKGDKGKTSLMGGKRVYKNDIQVETYGTIDELITWIGLIRSSELPECNIKMLYSPKNDEYRLENILVSIQDKLMICASIIATEKGKKSNIPSLKEEDITTLENLIDLITVNLSELNAFILPGGTVVSAQCHIARTVCRRAERLVISLTTRRKLKTNGLVIKYLNRLSDFLFTFARFLNLESKEILWKLKKG